MSGNAARKKAPEMVSTLLGRAMREAGIDKDIARYQWVLKWNEIVGEEIAKRTKPECVRDGVLVIRCVNSSWVQELTFQKGVIMNRLKKYVPDVYLRDVRFYVGRVTGKPQS